MISVETQRERQEDIDWRREEDVKFLKVQWNNYSPAKQVKMTLAYPEIVEQMLVLFKNLTK